jgi:hypothetical protein
MVEQKRWLQPASGKVVFNDRRDGPAPTGGLWVPVVLIPTMGDVPEFCPSTLNDIYEWLTDSEKYDLSLVDLDDESSIDWTGGIGTEVETLTVRGSNKSLEALLDIFESIWYFLVNRDDESPTEINIIYNPNATPITNLDIQQRIDERIAARIADQQKELGEGQPPKESDNEAPDLQEMMDEMFEQADVQEELKEQLEKRGQRESIYDQPTELDPDKIDPSMMPGRRDTGKKKGIPTPGPGPGPPPPPSEETPEDRARRRAMERMREIDEAVQESAETAENAEQQAETLVSDQPPEAPPAAGETVPSEEGTPSEEGAPSEEPPPDSNGEPAEDGAPGSPDDDTPGDGQCNPDDPDDPDCKGRFAILDNQSGGFL